MLSLCSSSPLLLPSRVTVWQRWVRFSSANVAMPPPMPSVPEGLLPPWEGHSIPSAPLPRGPQVSPKVCCPAAFSTALPPRTLLPFASLYPFFFPGVTPFSCYYWSGKCRDTHFLLFLLQKPNFLQPMVTQFLPASFAP